MAYVIMKKIQKRLRIYLRKLPSAKIDKIIANGVHITDNKQMAGEFNSFFTGIGQQISESVLETKINQRTF
jgi:hypothetical protein